PWIFVLAEPAAHEALYSGNGVGIGCVTGPWHDEGFDHLAAQCIGHAYHGDGGHCRVTEQHVLDLHRTHGPAGGDDRVIGAPGVVEIPVRIDPAAILGREPRAMAADLDLTQLIWRAGRSIRSLHPDFDTRDRAAERAVLDDEILGSGI